MTWPDGSWYDGDWDCGLRHGVGEWHAMVGGKETIYKGQWFNDLKHGVGEEEYPKKVFDKFSKVRGIWYHHCLNGMATYTQDAGCCQKASKSMVHKDGMSIDMSTGAMKCTFYIYMFASIACIVGMAAGGIIKQLALIPVCLIIYWIMSCFSQASSYIWNAMDIDGAYDNLDEVIKARPEVKWSIQCYHYETRMVTKTDSEGK